MLASLQAAHRAGHRRFALLLDPDHAEPAALARLLPLAEAAGTDYLLLGGSLVSRLALDALIREIRMHTQLPVVLFPGHPLQLSGQADALLYLSLISGRNPEYLIGHHVASAPLLAQLQLEVIPTGYMLVDCGRSTSASYMSGTKPLPYDKPELAQYTALAGQYLGLQCLYLDGGSGAERPISPDMIRAVRGQVQLPLLVGGGLRTVAHIQQALAAGADCVVVGTALERTQDADLLLDLVQAVKSFV